MDRPRRERGDEGERRLAFAAGHGGAHAHSSSGVRRISKGGRLGRFVGVHRDIGRRGCGRIHGRVIAEGGPHDDLDGIDHRTCVVGSFGAGIVPFDTSRGELLRRLRLPLDDEEHMPPSDAPQIGASDVRLLEAWIAQGATADLLASKLSSPVRP